jgi:hypothetical protein
MEGRKHDFLVRKKTMTMILGVRCFITSAYPGDHPHPPNSTILAIPNYFEQLICKSEGRGFGFCSRHQRINRAQRFNSLFANN